MRSDQPQPPTTDLKPDLSQASRSGGAASSALLRRIGIQDDSRRALEALQAGEPQEGVASTEQERHRLAVLLTEAVSIALHR